MNDSLSIASFLLIPFFFFTIEAKRIVPRFFIWGFPLPNNKQQESSAPADLIRTWHWADCKRRLYGCKFSQIIHPQT